MAERQTIVLCSVGNFGKYLCDELLADKSYDFVVISRQSKSSKGDYFASRNIDVRTSDYSTDSVLEILNEANASTFVSFNNCEGQLFVDLHCAWLDACRRSKNCKRFIPSEFAGNIDDYPDHPSYFKASRVPFRRILEQENDIEWTIFNNAWLMEYLQTDDISYMPTNSHEFPVNPNTWTALIRGSGDHVQSFTSGKDIGKALIMLFSAPSWEKRTFVTGQWATFNEVVAELEEFYDRPLEKFYRSKEEIDKDTALPATPENMEKLYIASVEEMMITGAGSLPQEKVLAQRERFFRNLHFTTVAEFLSQQPKRLLKEML